MGDWKLARGQDTQPDRNHLSAFRGPVASGAAVLENRPLIEQIVSRNRKLLAVEMETFGVFLAARVS
jgi:nucleoside phosphorylase